MSSIYGRKWWGARNTRPKFPIPGLLLFLLLTYACGRITGLPKTGSTSQATAATPTLLNATSTVESTTTALPAPTSGVVATESLLINNCLLLNSHDIASFFTRSEVMMPKHADSQVDHPVFSTASAAGRESSCLYYGFSNPGGKSMRLLQITYWVDLPDPAATHAWDQAWAQLKSEGETVPGVGQEAYFQDGRLTLKQGGVYITVEAIGDALNTITTVGSNPQLGVEKRLALDILGRLQ